MVSNKIYIVDGGVFSPPTKVVGELAYNIANYISKKHPNKNIEYHFMPTNKYYNKPWVRCVDEEDRIIMLKNLVEFIHKTYNVPSNIKFVVNDWEIKYGKKHKTPSTTLNTLTNAFTKEQQKHIYIASNIENVINRVNGSLQNSLTIFFKFKTICFDIYSTQLIGVNQTDKYINSHINVAELLKLANNKYPSDINKYFKTNNISDNDVKDFINYGKNSEKFEKLKNIIMEKIIILPKNLVPENYKAKAGNRLREELDVYYSSLENLQKFTTPMIENYITKNKLYHHCKSTYQKKLVSKTRNKKSRKNKSNKKSKTRKYKNTM